jgi:hypothetical protein
LLHVLADRGDKTVLPAVLQTALSGPKEVRIAALGVLPRLGDDTLVESLPPDEVPKTTVVFDASESPWGVQQQLNHRGISVCFAARDDDADSVIERLIAADSAPKRLTIVSSDHRLQRAAKRRKAAAVDSDVWFNQLLRDRAERMTSKSAANEPPKPEGPFSPGEVDRWLSEFGLQ